MSAVLRVVQAPLSPDELAGVWRADQLQQVPQAVLSSGHAELDAELPGGGWPLGQLTEVLQAQGGLFEWRLLLPALKQAVARGPLVLIAAPAAPARPRGRGHPRRAGPAHQRVYAGRAPLGV